MCNAFFDDTKLGDYTRHGIERFHFLNAEDEITGEDFTCGDNNDGVLIVDFSKIAYCFVNINNYGSLPNLVPVDVKSYVCSYSPESISEISQEDIDYETKQNGKTLADLEKKCKADSKINKLFFKKFKKEYKLLTTEDLIESFPVLESELIKAKSEFEASKKEVTLPAIV